MFTYQENITTEYKSFYCKRSSLCLCFDFTCCICCHVNYALLSLIMFVINLGVPQILTVHYSVILNSLDSLKPLFYFGNAGCVIKLENGEYKDCYCI